MLSSQPGLQRSRELRAKLDDIQLARENHIRVGVDVRQYVLQKAYLLKSKALNWI